MASSNSALSSLRYPYPKDVDVSDFVHVMLSEQNYFVWRELMLRLIESQGLVGFIDVEVSASHHGDRVEKDNKNDDVLVFTIPRRQEMENQQDWKGSDAVLQRWIIRTISEDVLPHVVHLETANAMWLTLKFLYGRNKAKEDYPYPVEVNVGNFVPIKLSGEKSWQWGKMMHRLIERQGLLDFINGKVPAPPKMIRITYENNSSPNSKNEVYNPDYKAWKRTDDLLQSWIIGLIDDKDVLVCLERLETAQKIWTTLIEVFNLLSFRKKVRHEETEEEDPMSRYLALLKAARTSNWKAAEEFITKNPGAQGAFITRRNETALMIAVGSTQGNHFVKKLLEEEFMKPEDVALCNEDGWTALHYAAMAGNTEAAKFLVEKNLLKGGWLPNICSKYKWSPLRVAAIYGGREMVEYLLKVTKDNVDPNPFEGQIGGALVKSLILAGLYDIALLLIQRYPKLAWEENSVMQNIAFNSSSAFKSGAHLNRCQNLIFHLVPTRLEAAYYFCGGDIENSTNSSSLSVRVKQQLYYIMWKVILKLVPQVKYIQEIKMKHEQALHLVKHICSNTLKLTHSKVEIMRRSLLYAANSGIPEVVEEIIDSFPELAYSTNEMGQNIFHVAVLNRCESVFNLIYQFRQGVRHHILTKRDSNNKSCLKLVVNLKNEQKLNLRASAAGAALQMQRELQWFKEVEKHTIIYYKEYRQRETTTSGRIYTEAHEELVKEGEKWMKDTATSGTIIAALVATVVFAAAITVPGGNDGENGLPIFFRDKAFIFFIIADAIALFSSISSVLMFSAILTSRYSVTDFLFTLPNRLIIGLITLFVSIISMMIAFGAILYLLFGHNGTWILIPIIVFSCFPVTLFWISQSPLLWDMMISTYGPGIFSQQSNRIIF